MQMVLDLTQRPSGYYVIVEQQEPGRPTRWLVCSRIAGTVASYAVLVECITQAGAVSAKAQLERERIRAIGAAQRERIDAGLQ